VFTSYYNKQASFKPYSGFVKRLPILTVQIIEILTKSGISNE